MKAHEMFAKVLKKRAVPLVEAAALHVRDELLAHRG